MAPLRADAQRNLARVLEAAADAFAEQGPDVSVDEIARRAGVGHATVFRRFPTKDALIAAVVQQRVSQLTALAEEALASGSPQTAFFDFVWAVAEIHARDRGLYDCLERCEGLEKPVELKRAVKRLVERAQRVGAVRGDVAPADVDGLIGAALKSAPPGRWRRYVEIVLDGLRPIA